METDDLIHGFHEVDHKLLFWRLKPLKTIKGNSLFELVRCEQLRPSPYVVFQLRVSDNYVVAALLRKDEVLVEVRSIVDLSVIYSVKERVNQAMFCFKFDGNVFGAHMVSASGKQFIRYCMYKY